MSSLQSFILLDANPFISCSPNHSGVWMYGYKSITHPAPDLSRCHLRSSTKSPLPAVQHLRYFFLICSHLTNASHSRNAAVAVACCLLLAPLGEEEVHLVIVTSAAAKTLPHKCRAHKVGLCVEKNEMNGLIQCFLFSPKVIHF